MQTLDEAAGALAELMEGRKTLALTGAGISTDAGIPDYRGAGRVQEPSVMYDQFCGDKVWQRWVWQRNEESWRSVAQLQPTDGHKALVRLEHSGHLLGIATQNVDNLHAVAGSKNVAELHGNFMRVVCVDCGSVFARDGEIDTMICAANPNVSPDPDPAHAAVLASADREQAELSTFVPPRCPSCGGLLKPDITFFGEALPSAPMDMAMSMASEADVILVAGSSLYVQTAVWVLRQGMAHGARLAIVNRGATACDSLADIRIEGGCSQILQATADILDMNRSRE